MTGRRAWTVLCGAMALFVVGCASSGVSRTVGPNDLPSLAGKWSGNISLPGGQTSYGTMDMSPNGDYVVQASGFSAQGKAQVKDGGLVLTPSASSGSIAARAGDRTSTAALSERSDGALVLKGFGQSSAGPFNFEVSKPK